MKILLTALVFGAVILPLAGCGPKDEDFNPDDIAVKQPGSGPPPINAPMSEGSGQSGQKSGN